MSRPGSALAAETFRGRADPSLPERREVVARELGEGRLERGPSRGRVQKRLRIDATGAGPNLLDRLLVGSYVTGQDQVRVTARGGLTVAQRQEIHRVVDRTIGMTVVRDSPATVEVQNFVDPGKHELPPLLHRVVEMLRTELEICRGALLADDLPFALLDGIEDEIDRLYLLMVRQLVLSSESPRIARSLDVPRPGDRIGDRLVAKVLEVTGDLIHEIGSELRAHLAGLRHLAPEVTRPLVRGVEQLALLLRDTMDAFGRRSVVDANAALNAIHETLPKETPPGPGSAPLVSTPGVAVAVQRIACHLDLALEMLILVNEVTINRGVEPGTGSRALLCAPVGSPSRGLPASGRFDPPSRVARAAEDGR